METTRFLSVNSLPIIEEMPINITVENGNGKDIRHNDVWFIRQTKDGKYQVYGEKDYNGFETVEAARDFVSLLVNRIYKPAVFDFSK